MARALRATVHSIDPQLPLTQLESMERVVEEGQAPRRFTTALVSSFAAAAVLLALLGIYGVIAYSTAQRTQEMAIRLALGSQRSSVMRLILISSAKLGLLGCGIGALAAVCHPAATLAAVCSGSNGPTCHRAGSIRYFSARTRDIGHSCVPCRLD
jgi:predicted lysophospholipase L1 biosynthesis ABC-type transport system permease subunit